MTRQAASREKIRFSYSSPEQSFARRSFIRTVETIGGQRRLTSLYDRFLSAPDAYGDFFDAAIKLLELDVRYDAHQLAKVPAGGPVLFIANHPYGVIDGVVLIWLARQARADVKVLTHKVLCQAPEARAHLLPIDFSGLAGALENNIDSRKQALRQLQAGGSIGIFPAGAVAASPGPWRGPAVDVAWHPFTAKLLRQSKATVVPIYFDGQNSRLFQMASHVSYTWRLSLFFWETARRMGSRLNVAIGDPIPFDECSADDGRTELLTELRRRTYALAGTLADEGKALPRHDREYVFPRHFKL
ncbi:MAG: lysophospholipid acyltransferase family protein [Alphaproteobacteria bacterium]